MQKRQSESGLVIIEKYDKFLGYIYPRRVYMKLKFSKWFIQKAEVRFLDFLGVRIKSTYKLLRKNSVTRAKRKIARFIRLELFDKLRMFLASWIGHATKADSYNLLKLLKWELEYARFNYNTNG